jgi:hypothetical protein
MDFFSIIKSIDFTNPDTLVFLAIIFVFALGVFLFFLFIAFKFFKGTKKLSKGRPKINESQGTAMPLSYIPKEKEHFSNVGGGDFVKVPDAEDKKEEKQEYKQKYAEKEQKDIAKGLSKLKAESILNKGTLESKMPSREAKQEEDNYKEIKIPVSKKFRSEEPDFVPAGGEKPKEQAEVAHQEIKKSGKESPLNPKPEFVEDKYGVHSAHKAPGDESPISSQKPEFMEDKYGVRAAQEEKTTQNDNQDQSIFQGQPEISRPKLEHELKVNPKVWQAQKQTGLTLSPVERAKLVKEVFSPTLGKNISKSDLKASIRKLGQKLVNTKNPEEHARVRKEINFFKKIGGIK